MADDNTRISASGEEKGEAINNEDPGGKSTKPKIKSLLDIDPWLDVPGRDNQGPPSKVPRLDQQSSPNAAKHGSGSSDGPELDEETSDTSGGENTDPSPNPTPPIRSLLDINPFEFGESRPRDPVPTAITAVRDNSEANNSSLKMDSSNGENADTADAKSKIPSLLDIDPFQGRMGPMNYGCWGIQQRNWSGGRQFTPTRARSGGDLIRQEGQGKRDDDKSTESTKKVDETLVLSLMKAIEEKDSNSVTNVLDMPSAHPNVIGPNGQTTLTLAARVGSSCILNLLLAAGADVNLQDSLGRTALHVLAQASNDKIDEAMQMAKALLDEKADGEIMDREGHTPLSIACSSGHIKMAEVLLKTSDVNMGASDGSTPLHFATKRKDVELVKLLLKAGANPDVKDSTYETPLIGASRAGNVAIVRALVEAKCDLNHKGFMEYTALHWAAHGGYKDITELLVENGADLTALSALVRTPLHRAVAAGHTDLVELLLKAGTPVDLLDANQETPLLTAIRYGFHPVVRLLLKANADPDTLGPRGKSPVVKAIMGNYSEIVDLLVNADCDLSALQMTAVKAEGQRFHWMEVNDSVQAFISRNQDLLSKPRSLAKLCRATVRKHIGSGWSILEKINMLPVPEKLRDFLSLKEELGKSPKLDSDNEETSVVKS